MSHPPIAAPSTVAPSDVSERQVKACKNESSQGGFFMKAVFRFSVLVVIGLLCVVGYAKQKADAPPVPPKGMVLIPAGEYQMGGSLNAMPGNHKQPPVHTVSADAFFMDEHEVTNLEYKKFVLANPRWSKDRIDKRFHDSDYLTHWNGNDYPSGYANHPVTWVSWYAAMAYAGWVEKQLPTEAEWEYAARGGLAGQKYPWKGDVIDLGKANYDGNVGETTPVGKYPPNGYGLYDMAGNVYEWCLDEYNKDFYFTSPRENPLSGANSVDWIISNFTSVNTKRVLRGGSWVNNPKYVRVAGRVTDIPPRTRSISSGFVVRGLSNPLNLYLFTPSIRVSGSI